MLALKNRIGMGWCDIDKRFNCDEHVWIAFTAVTELELNINDCIMYYAHVFLALMMII